MLKEPLISIIIPTYNRAHFIGETLDSVLAQTYQNWECIIIDDVSTDNTKKTVIEYLNNDSRFRFYERPNDRPKGQGACRNYGLEFSRGEYINWFDSDDLMCEKFLQKRIEIFNRIVDVDVVFCAYSYFNGEIAQNRIGNENFGGNILKDWMDGKVIFGPPSYLIRKNILPGISYDEQLQRTEDVDYFFKLFTVLKTVKIRHIPEILFKVRKHKDNISSDNDTAGLRLNSTYIVHKRLLDYFFKIQDQRAILKYKKQCLLDIKKLLENKNFKIVIKNIIDFKYLNFMQKSYLLFCVFTQFSIGRGANQFKNR